MKQPELELPPDATMPQFCDVAVAGPFDIVFTYRIPDGMAPVVGGRVLVPFRQQRVSGIVTELHERTPKVAAKNVISVLDAAPVLDDQLMRLGRWIADYYLAPPGEVFRTMLPLAAEFKRTIGYRMTDAGRTALHLAGVSGSSARSRRTPQEQLSEFRALDYLGEREMVREETLRTAVGISKSLLAGMVRKQWIVRADLSGARDAERTVKVALLKRAEGKLNANQQRLVDTLAAAGGGVAVETLQTLDVPRTTLATLVKRGLVEIVAEPAEFAVSGVKSRPLPLDFQFNSAQEEALARIRSDVAARRFSGMLLHGVTGSGKTAVYQAAMRSVLEAGRSAIMLVPEIGLTPAAAANLHQVFGDEVALLHSALSDQERAEQWHRIKRGDARIVVATRSGVFAPVSDLALVIVDEEQDSSYKQEETPRYHARDVAVMRAKMANAVVVLGSATPSLESYFNATKRKYTLLELPDRVEKRPLPEVEIIDMRQEFQETGHEQVISRKLTEEIGQRLERKEQVMVLLNRRGYSPLVLCRACGSHLECRNCAVAMTHHKREHRMVCHYCGFVTPVPKVCGECGSEYVQFLGTGSEKLEELLHGLFPQARIGRLDRDTVRGREDFERALNALDQGELDLLVGTQMIAKGHDIHGVTLVGVVGADAALGFPDFRAAERTFQLLTQVAGRAGRGQTPGKVVMQTFFPDHYAVQYAAQHDFAGFYEKELRFRSWMHYPPYSALANVLVRSDKLDQALTWSGILGKWFEKTRHEGIRVLGPAAAPIVRLKRDYRYHFVLKSASREKLNALLRTMLAYAAQQKIPRTQVIVDVDALWLM
ncbi:Replication restart DNA helicase PriA [Candidatus Sulfotelmatobacter sp. SbA7]|nr:Replication restart DNA helicase PriA [Candidatus Sulfotelmatobacter sp. SbA7]